MRARKSDPYVSDLRAGAIVARGLSIFFRKFAPFFLLALLIKFLPFIFNLVWHLGQDNPLEQTPLEKTLEFFVEVAASVLSYWLTVALVFATFQELEGRPAGLADSVRRGTPLIFPVIGVAILFWLATGLAALLLIIPGFAVATMYYVAIPVVVIEKQGVIASLRRSKMLTKGYRRQVFIIIVFIILIAISIFSLSFGVFHLLPLPYDENSPYYIGSYERLLGLSGISRVGFAFLSVLYPIICAVTYYKLRYLKEGPDVEHLTAEIARKT